MGTVIQSRILRWAWPMAMAVLLQAMMADPVIARDKGVASILTEDLYNEMLLHRNDRACPARGFYNYSAFIAAASAFPNFGNQGNKDIRKRELAAFFGQTAHETTGGWLFAPDGQNAWGYCFAEVMSDYVFCERSSSLKQWPCAAGKNYYGRGPLMLKWNHRYGLAGEALGLDLLNNPDLVSTNATVSFMTAISFWMKSSADGKPSCHDVINGKWKPSAEDIDAGRLPGYGAITNIFNGAEDCGRGPQVRQDDRIGFYNLFCDILGVGYGRNVDCNYQSPFPSSLSPPAL